jgi:hypothetical protein
MVRVKFGLHRILFESLVLSALTNLFLSASFSAVNHEKEVFDGEWKFVSKQSGIDTYMKHIPGTKLIAFRGVGILDVHISEALGLFCDLDLAHEWVEMLDSIQTYDILTAAYSSNEITLHNTSADAANVAAELNESSESSHVENIRDDVSSGLTAAETNPTNSTSDNKAAETNSNFNFNREIYRGCRPHGDRDIVHQVGLFTRHNRHTMTEYEFLYFQ